MVFRRASPPWTVTVVLTSGAMDSFTDARRLNPRNGQVAHAYCWAFDADNDGLCVFRRTVRFHAGGWHQVIRNRRVAYYAAGEWRLPQVNSWAMPS